MVLRAVALLVALAPVALAQTPCEGGSAAGFACSGVDLLARLPVSTFATPGSPAPAEMNDVWGWTDPASGREFALVGTTNGTAFVEVTTPASPVFLGKLPTATTASIWRDVKTVGSTAYIVAEAGNHGIQVFDLTRLLAASGAPQTFDADARYTGIGNAHNIVADEASGFVYAVGASAPTCGGGGLHIVDVREPLAPAYAGCFDGDGYTHDAQCLVYDGPDADHTGKEICVASNEDTVTIVDVSDKADPVLLARGFYPNPGYTHQGWFTEDRRYFVVDDELDSSANGTRTVVFDLSDLDAPEFAFEAFGTTTALDHNLYVRDGYVFQSNYTAGLRVLDGRDLASGAMPEVAFFDTFPANDGASFSGQWSNYPYFASGVVVANDGANGLFVLAPDVLASGVGSPEASVTATLTSGEAVERGERLRFTLDFANTGDAAFEGEFWVLATLPNGQPYRRPVVRPTLITLGPGETQTEAFRIRVPGNAPFGDYALTAYVGPSFPDGVGDASSFGLSVVPGASAAPLAWEVENETRGTREAVAMEAPEALGGLAVRPNPVRGEARVTFALEAAGPVTLSVLDLRGREVARLASGWYEAGEHAAAWAPEGLAPGTYLVRLATGEAVSVVRVSTVR